MRVLRNVSFLIMMILVGFVMSSHLRAGGFEDGPFCDDPGKDQVTWTAWGNCSEAEGDCAMACLICYGLVPKAVDVEECNAGTELYGATCTCYLVSAP